MSQSVKLIYGTELHDKIRDRIVELKNYGVLDLAPFYNRMKEDEEQFYAYIDTPTDESVSNDPKDEKNRPDYKTIKIPYAYSIVLSQHTYESTVFLSRDPILQVEGRAGESQDQELAVESILDYQITAGRAKPYLYNWKMDKLRYGVGILGCYWQKKTALIGKIVSIPDEVIEEAPGLFSSKTQFIEEEVTSFEGNELYTVKPCDFFKDPRFSFMEFQKGEFCGEFALLPYSRFQEGCADGSYIKQNKDIVDQLKAGTLQKMGRNTRGSELAAEEVKKFDPFWLEQREGIDERQTSKHVVRVTEFYYDLIPSEWGLGKTNRKMKFYFCLAEDEVIIAARPLPNYHNMYPFAIEQYEIDMYKKASRSSLSIMKPMENVLDYLVNQHFFNVRKHLNNNAIIDPSMVILKDLYVNNPSGLIRKRPEAYGKDPQLAYYQIPKSDITRAHLQDVRMMEEFAQRLQGVNDNIMGLVNPGGRKTAQEVRVSSSFATNRLKVAAEWASCTAWNDLTRMMIANTQQFLSSTMKVRIAGDAIGPRQQRFLEVDRDGIAGDFDFSPVDGTLPIDRFAVANLMRDMTAQIMSNQMLAQQYDGMALFEYVARLAGAKNISRFRVQVQSPEAIQQQAQAGNIVPMQAPQQQGNGPQRIIGGETPQLRGSQVSGNGAL